MYIATLKRLTLVIEYVLVTLMLTLLKWVARIRESSCQLTERFVLLLRADIHRLHFRWRSLRDLYTEGRRPEAV